MTARSIRGVFILSACAWPLLAVAQQSPNVPPVAAFDISTQGGEAPVYFTVDANQSSDPDGTIVSYDWDFGDTVTAEGRTAAHGYIYPRRYDITLTVTDAAGATASTTRTLDITRDPERAMFQLITNLNRQTPAEALALVDRAKAAGANTVFFSDTKVTNYGLGQLYNTQWERNADQVFQGIKDRGMDLVLNTISMGYCNTMLSDDVNLAAGYPVIDQEMVARDGTLVPKQTATGVMDGGFERASGQVFEGLTTQDEPGRLTFVDTNVFKTGKSSLRMEMENGKATRVATRFNVKPNTQYSLNAWVRTDKLSGNGFEFLLRDPNNDLRRLQSQFFSVPAGDGSDESVRNYIVNPNDLTTTSPNGDGWVQQRMAFNTGNYDGEAELFIAVFNGRSGTMWIDDLEIVNTPTMNWIVRDELPVTAKLENGTELEFGRDIDPIVDTDAGQSSYTGNFDTYHTPPAVTLTAGSRVSEGETVLLSGWHTMIATVGQVGCSWNNDTIHQRIREVHRVLENRFDPDGYLLNFDEIRHGGFEPRDTDDFADAGKALSASINRAYASMEAVTTDADYYFWSDMIDPFHNARDDYYHINGTLDGAWEGTLTGKDVVMATWWEQPQIDEFGRKSLQFFSDLGFEQVVGAFYDAPVRENFELWQNELVNVPGIVGNMYATWDQDYSKIEDYGRLWWKAP